MAITLKSNIKLIVDEITSFKTKPKDENLSFGRTFSDRMLFREYRDGQWLTGRIKKFENFSLNPAVSVLHYGQEIFEGLKAFRQTNGDIVMFRPDENAKRFNESAKRLVMPQLDEKYFIESLNTLVNLERDWVSSRSVASAY